MSDIPDDTDRIEDFEDLIDWIEECGLEVREGYDIHLGNCPECGMNEYFCHIFADDELEVKTNCVWCGHSQDAL